MARQGIQYDDGDSQSNVALRIGEIQEIVWPSDKRNLNKKFTEYTVLVQHRVRGIGVTKMYNHCVLSNMFGGLADRAVWTPRVEKTPSTSQKNQSIGLGAKVLLACINGESNNAVIIGGMRDASDKTDQDDANSKDLGHYASFIFNGISAFINKDGELRLAYKGKTNIDGKKNDDAKDSQVGTTFSLLKNGNAVLSDKDAKNAITIDHENSKVIIARDKAFELGDATDKMLLGESFRKSQQQMNNKLKQMFSTMKDLLQQAGTQLNSAVGTAPGAPIPAVTAAGALLVAASVVAGQMGQAIDSFEQDGQQKNSFLSKRNSAD